MGDDKDIEVLAMRMRRNNLRRLRRIIQRHYVEGITDCAPAFFRDVVDLYLSTIYKKPVSQDRFDNIMSIVPEYPETRPHEF